MTDVTRPESPRPPPAPKSGSVAIPWPSTLANESPDDRWARWTAKGVMRDAIMRRRFQIIGGVIAVGLTLWLVWTM